MARARGGGVKRHPVVTEKEWVAARKALLAKEKEFTRLGDELHRLRRALPWVKVEKEYAFDAPGGKESLADLFGRHSQLFVYHFMFGPGWGEGCPHCSFWADHYDGAGVHLAHRDVSFVAVSRAPLAEIEPFRKRMGWRFKWVSSADNDFNFDFHVSFTPEALEKRRTFYNYSRSSPGMEDREGLSVFYRDGRDVYHTYSAYARGIDSLNGTYHVLDLVPKGRDEDPDDPQGWVRYHDRYER